MKYKILLFSTIILALGIFIFRVNFQKESITGRGKRDIRDKVILIGIDGATWRVMQPLINEGRLPNISRLIREGSWGILLSEKPMHSPVLWTSIVTGKQRQEHGIMHLGKKDPNDYNFNCYTSADRRTKALWNILSDYGLSAGIVNWWATYPAEEINGFIVSDYFLLADLNLNFRGVTFQEQPDSKIREATYPKNIFRLAQDFRKTKAIPINFSYPGYRQKSIKEAISFIRREEPEKIDQPELKKMLLISRMREFSLSDMHTFLIGDYLLKKAPVNLFSIYFEGLDAIQHSHWEFYEPEAPGCKFQITAHERRLFSRSIPEYYEWYDNLIGKLLGGIDKENVTVIIVSDHGFCASCEPFPYLLELNLLFERLHWMKFKNEEIYWPGSTAYSPVGLKDDYKPICLNLQGRESSGIVKIEDYERLRKDVRDKLLALRLQDGRNLFVDVKLADNLKIENIDIKVKINPSVSAEDKLFLNGEYVSLKKFLIPSLWSGGHHIEGIIIMSGKHIKQMQEIRGATIYDVAPTILALLGIPVGKDMYGRVLTQAIEEEYISKNPILYVDSHDSGLTPRSVSKDYLFDETMKEKLRSIGYLQ